MPTTAGTGSEATKNAVISVDSPQRQKELARRMTSCRAPSSSIRSWPFRCRRAVTAHTGMDAITQLIESYISRRAKPIPQALAAQGLRLALPAIVEAVEDGRFAPGTRSDGARGAALGHGAGQLRAGPGARRGGRAGRALRRVPRAGVCRDVAGGAARQSRSRRAATGRTGPGGWSGSTRAMRRRRPTRC